MQDAMVCIWEPAPLEGGLSNKVHLKSIAKYANSKQEDTKRPEQDATSEITRLYNGISNSIRDGSLSSSAPYQIEINSCRHAAGSSHRSKSRLVVSLDASINGSKIIAHLVIGGSEDMDMSFPAGQSQHIFCHFPALGTWTQYKYDSLLSYCESVRKVAGALGSSQSKSVKAPMPCKVLSILKKNGDEVTEAGESVMVVESMKMEMSINVTADGKFETSLKKGDAVDEGKVLCSVV